MNAVMHGPGNYFAEMIKGGHATKNFTIHIIMRIVDYSGASDKGPSKKGTTSLCIKDTLQSTIPIGLMHL